MRQYLPAEVRQAAEVFVGFLASVFGGGETNWITVVIGLVIVIGLIILAVWALKLILNASNGVARGRARRLAVIETAQIDQKRQAVILRRDNTEHLVIIGGANDLVVETGIPVADAQTTARAPRKPVKDAAPSTPRLQPRAAPAASEPVLQPAPPVIPDPEPEPTPEPRPRSLRHTGLLRSTARTEPAFIPSNDVDADPETSDSDTNAAEHLDPDPVPDGQAQNTDDTSEHGDIDTSKDKKAKH